MTSLAFIIYYTYIHINKGDIDILDEIHILSKKPKNTPSIADRLSIKSYKKIAKNMKCIIKSGKKFLICLITGFVIFTVFIYSAVEITSTTSFCSMCHEIKPSVERWKVSEHGIVKGKIRATCRDCHIPSWNNPADVIMSKASHGIKDTYHHFFSKKEREKNDFYFAIKNRAIKYIPNERCILCHPNVLDPEKDIVKSEFGPVKGLHTSKDVKNLSCLMCHKNTGHLPW